MPDAPQPHQLAGVIQWHQHLGARGLGARNDDLISREPVRNYWSPQPQRLAGETGVRVEAERRTGLRRGVGDQLHLTGPRIITGESHLLPRDELARELLQPRKASG